MLQLGAVVVGDLMQQQQIEQPSLHRIILDALPRGKKFKPLVSEYGAISPYCIIPMFKNRTFLYQRVQNWCINDWLSGVKCGLMEQFFMNQVQIF